MRYEQLGAAAAVFAAVCFPGGSGAMSMNSVPLHGPPGIQSYVDNVLQVSNEHDAALVSIILFGSVVTGGFRAVASDIDMILAMADDAAHVDVRRLRSDLEKIEVRHGFRDPTDRPRGAIDRVVRQITGNMRSFFVCTRGDLVSGEVGRILGIKPVQAAFVDRAVLPTILHSAMTVWGEDILPHVPVQPIRRFDVFKALFGFCNQILLTAVLYPFVPGATKYAMGTLKRSVHNCYFHCNRRTAALHEEIRFFSERLGRDRTLDELMSLRVEQGHSFPFVVRCLPALLRLHLYTARVTPLSHERRRTD
jgi:predicted nucleotidyltransferase